MALLDDRINNLEDVPDQFADDYIDSLPSMLARIIAILAILELIDGKVVLSVENQQKVAAIGSAVEASLLDDPKLQAALVRYARSFNDQEAILQKLYSQFDGYQQKAVYRNIIANSQQTALEALGEGAIRSEIIPPLKQFVNSAISSEQSFSSLVASIENALLDPDSTLIGNIRTASRDFFSVSDASYTIAVSNDLGIEWFLYTGQTVKESRGFCLERKGKVFHKTEIRGWAKQDWQGKIPTTDSTTIFIFRGGYNCLDLFMPVDESDVPLDVIARIK